MSTGYTLRRGGPDEPPGGGGQGGDELFEGGGGSVSFARGGGTGSGWPANFLLLNTKQTRLKGLLKAFLFELRKNLPF